MVHWQLGTGGSRGGKGGFNETLWPFLRLCGGGRGGESCDSQREKKTGVLVREWSLLFLFNHDGYWCLMLFFPAQLNQKCKKPSRADKETSATSAEYVRDVKNARYALPPFLLQSRSLSSAPAIILMFYLLPFAHLPLVSLLVRLTSATPARNGTHRANLHFKGKSVCSD